MSESELHGKLVSILSQMEDEADLASVKEEQSGFLYSVTPRDLALAEQALIDRGAQFDRFENRLRLHMKLLVNPARELYDSLPTSHVIKRLIAEHRQIEYLLGELQQLADGLSRVGFLTAASPQFRTLIHIASHAEASSKHTDAEEQVILPALEHDGIEAVPRLLRAQHFEIRHHSVQLYELAFTCCTQDLVELSARLRELADRLLPLKQSHILIEENLIYPIALGLVPEQTWQQLTETTEQVGFCCFL